MYLDFLSLIVVPMQNFENAFSPAFTIY